MRSLCEVKRRLCEVKRRLCEVMRHLCEVIRHPRVLTINCALFLLFFSNDSYIMMIALGNRLNLDILSSVKLNESSKNCLCCAIIIFINIAILNII